MKRSPINGWLLGILVFVLANLMARGFFQLVPNTASWSEQVLMKTVLIILSIIAILYFLKITLVEAGFRKVKIPLNKSKIILGGMAIGALATLLIYFSPAKGIPMIKELNLFQFLLIIVVWSSISEEVLVRGFIQTYLAPFAHKKVHLFSFSLSIPVFICALLFSSIHLSLLFANVDYLTVSITLFTTFLLGLLAGIYKEKYNSIIPSILTHMSFNVGGIVAGIFITIAYKIITGEFPPQ